MLAQPICMIVQHIATILALSLSMTSTACVATPEEEESMVVEDAEGKGDSGGRYTVLHVGSYPCAEFTKAVADSSLPALEGGAIATVTRNGFAGFAAGWISQANRMVPGSSNWLGSVTLPEFMDRLQVRCTASPTKAFHQALELELQSIRR